MLIRPLTLTLITTHTCTASCDHCCFSCTPKVKVAMPYERMERLIDEAREIPSIRVVVFSGGECFLLGEKLDALVARVRANGFMSRCITNGYWAINRQVAERRVARLVDAGLDEINFSTGSFHARDVPVQRIVHGARATSERGITTLINAEVFEGSDFDITALTEDPDLKPLIAERRLIVQRNVWIPADGESALQHKPEHSRFNGKQTGCSTSLGVLAVTPTQSLVACCGLHLERIPDLHFGSVEHRTIKQVLDETPDDFLKIWIHVEGPERVLEFVKEKLPSYELPVQSVHPCTTCLHLYRDETAKAVLREHYRERMNDVMMTYLAGLGGLALNNRVRALHQSGVYAGFGSD